MQEHQFGIGETLALDYLADRPDLNGELVTVTDFREDGEFGKSYFIQSLTNEEVNIEYEWIYEYRLRRVNFN